MTTLEKRLNPFVGDVLARSNLDYDTFRTDDLNDFDGRRILVALDNDDKFSYIIRTWHFDNNCIHFTFYKDNQDTNGAEELFSGSFSYSTYTD